jgi:hypothetical protein
LNALSVSTADEESQQPFEAVQKARRCASIWRERLRFQGGLLNRVEKFETERLAPHSGLELASRWLTALGRDGLSGFVENQVRHGIVPVVQGPESKLGSDGRRRNQRIGELQTVRSAVTRQIGACVAARNAVEDDLAARVEKRFGESFFPGSNSRVDLCPRDRGAVGRYSRRLES